MHSTNAFVKTHFMHSTNAVQSPLYAHTLCNVRHIQLADQSCKRNNARNICHVKHLCLLYSLHALLLVAGSNARTLNVRARAACCN
jgi:hypothetical protein